jgi:HTH-type transcriptional regulator/antitoxin HigA
MNLESSYQLSKTSFETQKIKRRAKLYDKFPVKEMMRRGWIPTTKDMDKLERAFCAYFSISSIDDAPTFAHSAKKQCYTSAPEISQLAWLIRAEQIAKGLKVKAFTVDALNRASLALKTCLRSTEDVHKVPSILTAAGVRFVIVKFIPGAKLDGACFWINGAESPVIAMSLRFDRVDNFWHTLFHEVDHILHGEGKQAPIVDVVEIEQRFDAEVPEEERRANESAGKMLIDSAELERFIISTAPVFSRREIVAFAESVNVHPALVLGQLQHRGLVRYSFHRDLLEPVRPILIESIQTDGFEGSGGT